MQTGGIVEANETLQLTKPTKFKNPRVKSQTDSSGLKSIVVNNTKSNCVENISVTNKIIHSFYHNDFNTFDSLLSKRLALSLGYTVSNSSDIHPINFFLKQL